MATTFEDLNKINVNDHKEGKNGLSYLSWTWAWAAFKKALPDATYEIKTFENNLPYVYDEKTGYMVFTSVTAGGITHDMWLPVMDSNNKAMKSEPYTVKTKYKEINVKAADMFDINKTLMRCLVKNLAMFGLGLYIYSGEDLPEEEMGEYQEKIKLVDQLTALVGMFKEGTEKGILKKYGRKTMMDMTSEELSETISILETSMKKKADQKHAEQEASFKEVTGNVG